MSDRKMKVYVRQHRGQGAHSFVVSDALDAKEANNPAFTVAEFPVNVRHTQEIQDARANAFAQALNLHPVTPR